jgi:hypothetical protein
VSEWAVTALLVAALFGVWGAFLATVITDINREHRARVAAVNAIFAALPRTQRSPAPPPER